MKFLKGLYSQYKYSYICNMDKETASILNRLMDSIKESVRKDNNNILLAESLLEDYVEQMEKLTGDTKEIILMRIHKKHQDKKIIRQAEIECRPSKENKQPPL